MQNEILGIDIGGTGTKGAIVNMTTGKLLTERLKFATPSPATPEAMADTVQKIVEGLNYKGKLIGCGFPAIVVDGVAKSAANIDKSWVGVNIEEILAEKTGCKIKVVNDADAAGMAEVAFGKAKGRMGTVLLLTIGTGIGSAMFTDGHLVRNTELGHFHLKGQETVAEKFTSNIVRKEEDLDWKTWAKRFNQYLARIERMFTPNLIILGGGTSKRFELYRDFLKTEGEIVPAQFKNEAGVIGAAMYAAKYG
ncbi:MAG: polyphosphate glucokinase [Paraglaciecola sp.]|jgi:polyphosphate glucokinase